MGGSGVRGSTGKRKHGLATVFGTVPRKESRMDGQAPVSRLLQGWCEDGENVMEGRKESGNLLPESTGVPSRELV